jgi:hypothetical protein
VPAADVNDATETAGEVGHPRREPDPLQGDPAYDSGPHREGSRRSAVDPLLSEKGNDDATGRGRTRRPVEGALARVDRNRRLRIRHERPPDIHKSLLTPAWIGIGAAALFAGFCRTLQRSPAPVRANRPDDGRPGAGVPVGALPTANPK